MRTFVVSRPRSSESVVIYSPGQNGARRATSVAVRTQQSSSGVRALRPSPAGDRSEPSDDIEHRSKPHVPEDRCRRNAGPDHPVAHSYRVPLGSRMCVRSGALPQGSDTGSPAAYVPPPGTVPPRKDDAAFDQACLTRVDGGHFSEQVRGQRHSRTRRCVQCPRDSTLPSRNSVRLEPRSATRREATFTAAYKRPRSRWLGAFSCRRLRARRVARSLICEAMGTQYYVPHGHRVGQVGAGAETRRGRTRGALAAPDVRYGYELRQSLLASGIVIEEGTLYPSYAGWSRRAC